MTNKPGTYIILLSVLIASLAVYFASTPPSANKTPPEGAFSVPRAYQLLRQIAAAPHSIGTPYNALVREYIDSSCSKLGLVTEIQHTTSLISYGRTVIAGNVYNIVATLKGQNSDKAVLIAAHYDSQPNAFGAGDDGAGCAAMLETARLLKAGPPLKNDVIFLFTDGEEDGLLGANAFVKEDSMLKKVGIVINFEGRGNSGISNMFETNPDNGWVVKEFARSAKHPFASSLNYEIYKTLPNNTDYSIFKAAGIAGLNNAYIDGFVNYHSMTDQPQNMDAGSFQDHGDNMLSLAKHFGNADLNDTRAPDITYFDIVGDWLVHYPASWNLFILILGNLAFIACLVTGFVRKKIRPGGFVWGLVLFPLMLLLQYFLGSYFFKAINSIYPLNTHFYAANAYNAHNFFFAAAALAIAVFSLIYQWILRKFDMPSLLCGILLVTSVGMDLLFASAPTAIYFVAFPLLFLQIGCLIQFNSGIGEANRPWSYGLLYLLFLLPALLLLPPIVKGSFVAFGLTNGSGLAVVLLGLLLGLLLPVLALAFSSNRFLVPGFAFICFLLALGFGQLHSRFSPNQPLQTNVRYLLDADKGAAYWTSEFGQPDYWNKQFFTKRITDSSGKIHSPLINSAPPSDLAAPILTVQKDTLVNGNRELYLHCQPQRDDVISAVMVLDGKDSINRIIVDGKEVAISPKKGSNDKNSLHYLVYKGLSPDGFDVMFGINPKSPFELDLFDRSMGLPILQGLNTSYPRGIIPGPGDNSNTTQVIKHYRF
jgi:hypothetical protein